MENQVDLRKLTEFYVVLSDNLTTRTYEKSDNKMQWDYKQTQMWCLYTVTSHNIYNTFRIILVWLIS